MNIDQRLINFEKILSLNSEDLFQKLWKINKIKLCRLYLIDD